jgi:cellulose synthase/poly-beta-1,6-N-acetylglucosamine synthase-like glycosyltransferase
VAVTLFWMSVAILGYVYVGFPLLVIAVGRWRGRRVRQQPITPPTSLIIAAYNEQDALAARLDNALSLDYPPGALEIVVASDGSTDRTVAVARAYAARGVRALGLPRRGKMHALDAAVGEATGDILVFTDANTMFAPDALRRLARNFADPEVGGVAGSKVYTLDQYAGATARGETLYWSYDEWIKHHESLTGSIVAADGAIYAIRRSCYRPCDDAAVTDDFATSTAVVAQGFRLVFEPEARAMEAAMASAECEFRRKVRLMTRGLRGLALRRRLLNPFHYGFYALVLFSHKVLRRLVPLVLVVLLLATLASIDSGDLYISAALAQAGFYGMAAVGYLLRDTRWGRAKCCYIPFFYCLGNAAALVALVRMASGARIEAWRPQRHEGGMRTQ